MLSDKQKQMAAEFIINETPEPFLEQFIKLTDLYNTHKSSLAEDLTNKERFNKKINYINESYNIINLLIKYIAITSSEQDGLERLAVNPQNDKPQNAPSPTKPIKNDNILDKVDMVEIDSKNLLTTKNAITAKNKEIKKKTISPDDIIRTELEAYGITPGTFTYSIFMEIAKVSYIYIAYMSTDVKYLNIIRDISKSLNKSPGVISSAIAKALSKADLSLSHIEDIRTCDGSKEYVVCKLYDVINADKFGGSNG